MQEITYEASGSTAFPSAVTTWGFTPDAGTQAGDVFLVQVANRQHQTYTVPSGASMVVPITPMEDGEAKDRRFSVFAWTAPADAPGPVSFTASGAAEAMVTWVRFRGVDTANPVIDYRFSRHFVQPGGVDSFHVPMAGARMVAGVMVASQSYLVGFDEGLWTERVVGTSVVRSIIATKVPESYPLPSQVTAIYSRDSNPRDMPWALWHLALRPGSDAPVDPEIQLACMPMK